MHFLEEGPGSPFLCLISLEKLDLIIMRLTITLLIIFPEFTPGGHLCSMLLTERTNMWTLQEEQDTYHWSVNVGDLTSDVHQHLVQLKSLKTFQKTDVNELILTENRKGQAFQSNDVICAFHRYEIYCSTIFQYYLTDF